MKFLLQTLYSKDYTGMWSQGAHSKQQVVMGKTVKLDRVCKVQIIFSESSTLSSTVLYNNKQCMSCS